MRDKIELYSWIYGGLRTEGVERELVRRGIDG